MPLNRPQIKRIGTALAASVAARLPFWIFQLAVGARLPASWTEVLCQWDCKLYGPLSEVYQPSAFFPGFPLLIHGVRALTGLGGAGAAILVSNLFAVLAGVLILFAGDALWGRGEGAFSKRSWLLLVAVSIFPSAHFWSRGYSEPVLMSALVLLVILIARESWTPAACVAGFSAVIRPQGVWIAAVFAAVFLMKTRPNLLRWFTVGILTSAPFAIFMAWLWMKTGDPLYFLKQQSGWGRHFDLVQGFKDHRPRFDIAVVYLYAAIYAAYRFVKRPEAVWVFLTLATFALGDFPIFFGGFYSYVRFASINLGIFVLLAEVSRERPKLTVLWILWALIRLAIEVDHASLGLWVG